MKIEYAPGATPIEPDQLEQLIPSISTKRELDEFEALNIRKGREWASKSRRLRSNLLTVGGLLELHKRMLGDVWEWAGTCRLRETTIGIEPYLISQQVHSLCGDVAYWIDNRTYAWQELAVRFHHRLVCIHPFPNGNGRHARLAADLLLDFHDQDELTWGGGGNLVETSERRAEYLAALREADGGSHERLLRFAMHV